MIYLDTSVALAQLLAEDKQPPEWLWQETLVTSRLLEYELWARIHARKLARTHAQAVQELLGHLAILELSSNVLSRALEPFPVAVRTLDAMHLASLDYLRRNGQTISLASYDRRMLAAAKALQIDTAELDG